MYVCKGLHHYVFYLSEAARTLADILRLKRIQLPSYSVFVGHGWLQNAGAVYLGHHNMHYHLYLVPQNVSINDEISLSYRWNLQISENDRTDSTEARGDIDDVLQGVEIEDEYEVR